MSPWTWAITITGSILALWSITWILRAQHSGPDIRIAEQEARERVAQGQGWDGAAAPPTIPDEVLARLARAQEPLTLAQAGVVARPRPQVRRRRRARRKPADS